MCVLCVVTKLMTSAERDGAERRYRYIGISVLDNSAINIVSSMACTVVYSHRNWDLQNSLRDKDPGSALAGCMQVIIYLRMCCSISTVHQLCTNAPLQVTPKDIALRRKSQHH